MLSPGEQDEVRSAFREVGRDLRARQPSGGTVEGGRGVRWSDLEAAVGDACEKLEAVDRSVLLDEPGLEARFAIETIEGDPGELTVRRRPDAGPPGAVARIGDLDDYIIEVTIGRFPEDPDNVRRSARIVTALRDSWRAWGRKARWVKMESVG